MAGVHSPSDAFAHLQHHQHNGLLGPSMQVRGPPYIPNLLYCTLQPLPVYCGPSSPAANPIHYFPVIHKTVRSVGIARLSCLFNHFGMRCVALQTVQISFELYISIFIVSVTHQTCSKREKASRKKKCATFEACCFSTVPASYTFPVFYGCITLHSHKKNA